MGSSNSPSDDAGADLVNLAYERAKRTHPSRFNREEFFANHPVDETPIQDSLYGGPCPTSTCDHPYYDHDSEGRCHAAADDNSPKNNQPSPSWGLCGCGRSGGEHIS